MRSKATRSAVLSIELDFSTKTAAKRAIRSYADEIHAGMSRTGMTLKDVADKAGVSMFTVWKHRWQLVANPQVRTMFGILFALGWAEVTVVNPKYAHTAVKRAA